MIMRRFQITLETDEACRETLTFESEGLTPREIYGYIESMAARMRCDIVGSTSPILKNLIEDIAKR
jgi:hypothetical protein